MGRVNREAAVDAAITYCMATCGGMNTARRDIGTDLWWLWNSMDQSGQRCLLAGLPPGVATASRRAADGECILIRSCLILRDAFSDGTWD